MKGKILVFFQFFFIFLMLLPIGSEVHYLKTGLVIIAFGLLIGFSAIKQHSSGNFNIVPDIKENCTLVTDGVYAYIRHPMYASVIVSMFGVLSIYATYSELLLFGLLCVNMLVKLLYEESLWHCKSEEYINYTKKTKRLIPFVF